MTDIHILHENEAWLPPFRAAFDDAGLAYREWPLDGAAIDLAASPPSGVFYNRMSASALTRSHTHAASTAAALIGWLEAAGRQVANGTTALRLELSKAAQLSGLAAAGVATPRTVAALGPEQIERAAGALGQTPFILKPNRGGKGLGVRLIQDLDHLRALLPEIKAEESADGAWLAQEYCPSPDGAITRLEFIGGRLHYAVRVNAGGAFELCPAEACALPGAPPMFQIVENFDHALAVQLESFLAAHGVDVAGVEYVETTDGRRLVYDVNTNTNYNPEAEAAAGVQSGPAALAQYLAGLAKERRRAA